MNAPKHTTLFWFSNDLRLHDQPALQSAAGDAQLACVYVIDPQLFRTDRFGNRRMGRHRWKFLAESLLDLRNGLAELGHNLHVLEAEPVAAIAELLDSGRFTRVVRMRQHAIDEVKVWQRLQQQFSHLQFEEVDGNTLFRLDQLNLDKSFPKTFSRFRRQVGDSGFRQYAGKLLRLPEPATVEKVDRLFEIPGGDSPFSGGETAARAHLDRYFSTRSAFTYKETRNQFQGEDYSTQFSPWLAAGCVSPMAIAERLTDYERQQGANDSTGWILFELLWREYFQWYGHHHQHRLFRFAGVNPKGPLTSFYSERFHKWSQGKTPWPIVNACMNELNETGFIGNRARQIVASCLINELELDWRCGAGYFEQQLIDYDACSNWGNWQYIAGVGADPKGGRHFNLEQQAEFWDADGSYRRKWAGSTPTAPLDSFDYYDWPVLPDADGTP